MKNHPVKYINPRSSYSTVYFGLPEKAAKKLKNLARKEKKTESEVLRHIIDDYLKKTKEKKPKFEPFRKFSPVGLKTLPRTIRKEQDAKIRKLAEETGRPISEIVRDAVERFK